MYIKTYFHVSTQTQALSVYICTRLCMYIYICTYIYIYILYSIFMEKVDNIYIY